MGMKRGKGQEENNMSAVGLSLNPKWRGQCTVKESQVGEDS